MNNVIKYYRSPDPALWKGRLSNPSSLNQYWHEAIKFYHDGLEHLKSERLNSDFGILGYACDEGVKRNNGRQGAVNGPKAIREQLSKLSAQFSEKTVTDYGDIVAHENNIELAQKLFSNVIKEIIKSGQLSIGIGGSHDLAYGHFCGIQKALPKVKSTKIGILYFLFITDIGTFPFLNPGISAFFL